MLDAAALAAILDPGKVFSNWWEWDRKGYSIDESSVRYIGPPDLHTAREHAWRLENWLEARGFNIHRLPGWTYVYRDKRHHPKVYEDANHTAALVVAIERISNG